MNTKKHDEDEDPKDTRNPQNPPGSTPTQPNFPQPTAANPPPQETVEQRDKRLKEEDKANREKRQG